ncbi:MAG: hypothetical protein WD708_04805 [Kiritimatiellia bacterium]
MTEPLPPPMPAQSADPDKGRNCWVVGCSGCLIAFLLLIVVVGIAFWSLKRSLMVDPFGPVEMTAVEKDIAEAKLTSYNMLNSDGKIPEDFTFPEGGILLTENEVNYWISRSGNDLSDAVRLDFEPNFIGAEMRIGDPGSSRWLITAEVSVEQTESGPDIRLINARLGKFSLPKSFMEEISKENLMEDLLEDEESREEIKTHVERIEVLKDQIRIVPKPQAE